MSKVMRKLSLIPVLVVVVAASLSTPHKAGANIPACYIEHEPCPDEMYDCCCGAKQACLSGYNAYNQCLAFCGILP